MNVDEAKAKIEAAVPGVALKRVGKSLLIEKHEDLLKIMNFLKTSEDYKLDYLSSLTGADYLQFLETVYHLYSMEKKIGPLVLRVRTDRNNPKTPSLVSVYRGAEYQEREAYDMYGIIYENHPDLRRIFMWEGFEFYPMRKDYVQEDSETLETQDVGWLKKHGVKVPEVMAKHAEELKAQSKSASAQKPGPETP